MTLGVCARARSSLVLSTHSVKRGFFKLAFSFFPLFRFLYFPCCSVFLWQCSSQSHSLPSCLPLLPGYPEKEERKIESLLIGTGLWLALLGLGTDRRARKRDLACVFGLRKPCFFTWGRLARTNKEREGPAKGLSVHACVRAKREKASPFASPSLLLSFFSLPRLLLQLTCEPLEAAAAAASVSGPGCCIETGASRN